MGDTLAGPETRWLNNRNPEANKKRNRRAFGGWPLWAGCHLSWNSGLQWPMQLEMSQQRNMNVQSFWEESKWSLVINVELILKTQEWLRSLRRHSFQEDASSSTLTSASLCWANAIYWTPPSFSEFTYHIMLLCACQQQQWGPNRIDSYLWLPLCTWKFCEMCSPCQFPSLLLRCCHPSWYFTFERLWPWNEEAIKWAVR